MLRAQNLKYNIFFEKNIRSSSVIYFEIEYWVIFFFMLVEVFTCIGQIIIILLKYVKIEQGKC